MYENGCMLDSPRSVKGLGTGERAEIIGQRSETKDPLTGISVPQLDNGVGKFPLVAHGDSLDGDVLEEIKDHRSIWTFENHYLLLGLQQGCGSDEQQQGEVLHPGNSIRINDFRMNKIQIEDKKHS